MSKFSPLPILFLLFTAALAAQQDQSQNMFRLAQALEQQGDHERALTLYADLYRPDSSNVVFFDALRRCYVQLKRYDAAVQLCYARLAKLPADVTLRASIGGLYSMAGKESQADSAWNSILTSAQKNQTIFRIVANEQVNQRLFDKAVATYLRGRNGIGDQFLFASELAYLYSFTMDYANMTREYLQMLRQNEQQFDFIQSRLSSVISRPDALKASSAVVEEELRRNRTIPLLRLNVWMLMEGNRYAEAFTAAQTLESLVDSQGQELFNFAERVFKEHAYMVAASAYLRSLQGNPKAPFEAPARFGYARCIEELSALGNNTVDSSAVDLGIAESKPSFSGAIGLYSALAKQFPSSGFAANALYRIGYIRYRYMFDLDGALRVFDSVLTVTPAGPMIPTVLSSVGDILIAQNKLDPAALKFRSMNVSPYADQDQRNFAQFRQAELRFFRSDFDSAIAILKPLTENLKADESNDALLLQYFITENKFQFLDALKMFARAELLTRQGKLSEASGEFASVIDLYPAAPLADDALLKIAGNALQLKKYSEALAAYQRLLEEFKESGERDRTYFRIGEVYQFHLSDKQKAIAAYEVILEKYPYSLFAEEARKRIRLLRGDAI